MKTSTTLRRAPFSNRAAAVLVTGLMAMFLAGGAIALSGQVRDAKAAGSVELTYTKWFSPGFPTSVGVVGGDFTGTFAGTVLERELNADGQIVHFTAQYSVTAGANSFSALVDGEQNNETSTGVVNGEVTAGPLTGAQIHEEYNVISCTQAPSGKCFQGSLSII
jgi:hypothetical protein